MKKEVILMLTIIIVLFLYGCSKCPETCEDNNPCTADSCGEGTNFQCNHVPLNEKQPGCSVDITCGTKTCKDGVCETDYEKNCCGNEKCETGETYDDCPDDCPNCDDDNKCTKDSYDYHEKKCINELIIPCCGNGICDEDVETYSSCPVDCLNCDDNDILTTDIFNYETHECESVVTQYFFDDFEEGAGNWWFSEPTAWSIIVEDGNTVLRGTGHNWADLRGEEWDDYIFKVRFKIIKGCMHFNYRLNNEGVTTRYMVIVEEDSVRLRKTTRLSESATPTHPNLGRKKTVQLYKTWHTFEMRGYGNILNVYIDDELLIKYKDTDNPALSGRIAFETLSDAEFLIDDVEIKTITEKDIISP